MSRKLIAMGNILMEDDGIAIAVAHELEEELLRLGIEVIYGETDPFYCISMIKDEDYLILLDAASLGKMPGEITMLSLWDYRAEDNMEQHNIRFPDLLGLYFRRLEGMILAIEVAEIDFLCELSPQLKGKVKHIAREVLALVTGL
ncbi:MAG TPA: hydrogenase maturation protease [Mobilitalea sp.]|nr:hydrogenase maturation protease [Mobilitalea sp.]